MRNTFRFYFLCRVIYALFFSRLNASCLIRYFWLRNLKCKALFKVSSLYLAKANGSIQRSFHNIYVPSRVNPNSRCTCASGTVSNVVKTLKQPFLALTLPNASLIRLRNYKFVPVQQRELHLFTWLSMASALRVPVTV